MQSNLGTKWAEANELLRFIDHDHCNCNLTLRVYKRVVRRKNIIIYNEIWCIESGLYWFLYSALYWRKVVEQKHFNQANKLRSRADRFLFYKQIVIKHNVFITSYLLINTYKNKKCHPKWFATKRDKNISFHTKGKHPRIFSAWY